MFTLLQEACRNGVSLNTLFQLNEQWNTVKVIKLSPKDFNEYRTNEDVFILDVRSLNKQSLANRESTFIMDNSTLSGNYIADAHHIPLVYLEDYYHLIPKDRNVLITDWIMKQAPMAAKFLIRKGYPVVGILKGGTARWQSEGFPLIQRENNRNSELLCD